MVIVRTASQKPPRYIVCRENRKKVVEAFEGVDEVISQTTLDYSGNLIKLKPRYVVHVRRLCARRQVVDLSRVLIGATAHSSARAIGQARGHPRDRSVICCRLR